MMGRGAEMRTTSPGVMNRDEWRERLRLTRELGLGLGVWIRVRLKVGEKIQS